MRRAWRFKLTVNDPEWSKTDLSPTFLTSLVTMEVDQDRQQLLEKFEELEQRWFPNESPDRLHNNVFNMRSNSMDLFFEVNGVFRADWKLYVNLRGKLEDMGIKEALEADMDTSEKTGAALATRFARFQENIFYGRETLLRFIRVSSSKFPFSEAGFALVNLAPGVEDAGVDVVVHEHLFEPDVDGAVVLEEFVCDAPVDGA